MPISDLDLSELKMARELLEHPGLASKLTALFGVPLEKGFSLMPLSWAGAVQEATRKSMNRALNVAVRTLNTNSSKPPAYILHRVIVAAQGAAAGAFGLPALIVELPASTTIMLRSIADIARSEGENIRSLESRLACLEVFALGGRPAKDDAAETGYFAVRAVLARAVSDAAKYIAQRGLVEEGAPPLIRLIVMLSSRFGVVVSEKLAAQSIPVIGAAGGALINTVFINHFQKMARGHFVVRRLERAYGAAEVREMYARLSA